MDNDIKSFAINVLAGLFTAVVFLYLHENGFTSSGYIVFGLYVALTFLVAFRLWRHRKAPKNVTNTQFNENEDVNEKETLEDQFNRSILLHILKLRGLNQIASPKNIANQMKQGPGIILAHLWKLHNEQFVTFITGGLPPTQDTNFFLSPKAFDIIDIDTTQQVN